MTDLGQQMRWDKAAMKSGTQRSYINSGTGVDYLPKVLRFPSGTTLNLEADQHEASTGEKGEYMWLNGSYEALVVPVHQMSLLNGFYQIHRRSSTL